MNVNIPDWQVTLLLGLNIHLFFLSCCKSCITAFNQYLTIWKCKFLYYTTAVISLIIIKLFSLVKSISVASSYVWLKTLPAQSWIFPKFFKGWLRSLRAGLMKISSRFSEDSGLQNRFQFSIFFMLDTDLLSSFLKACLNLPVLSL